jgi:hypothetical protein
MTDDKVPHEKSKTIKLKEESRYWVAFLVLTCLYFSEVFLKGAVLAIGDGFDYFYPMMITMSRQYKNFTFPFWNPQMFSGFPLFGSMQPGALYPFNIVLPLLFKPALAFNLNLMFHYSLAGFFTYLYSRQIGLAIFPSLISGTVFSFLGYLPSHLIHPSILASGIWIPLLLLFCERLKNKPNIKDAIYASFIIVLQVFAGHPQVCFYTYIMLMLYIVFHMFYIDSSKRWRFALFSILSLGLGILLALPQLMATYELTTLGARVKTTYEFFSSYAFPAHMLPSFLFPFFYYFGGSYSGEYWGTVPDLGMEAFVGTLPFLLSLLVVMRWKRNPHILFWGMVAFLAFVLALGDATGPLNRALFHLPLYNSFRGPSKHILELSLAMSILTGFGVSFLQEPEKEKRFARALMIVLATVIVGSLITFTFLREPVRDFLREYFSGMKHFQLSWVHGDIPEKALGLADPSIYIPVLIMTAYLVCLFALLKARKKYLRYVFLLIIFLLIFAEGRLYKLEPVPDANTIENYHKELYAAIASDAQGRTAFLTNKISLLSALPYGISLVDGYDPLLIKDYDKLLPPLYVQNPETWRLLLENNSLLSMLNADYLVIDNLVGDVSDIKWWIVKDKEGGSLPIPPAAMKPAGASEPVSIYRKVASYPLFSVYKNSLTLPRAYPVLRLKPSNSVDELMKDIFSFQLNPWQEAVLSPEDLREIGSDNFSFGEVKISEERPDRITISTKFKGQGFVVLADQYYPGWKAYIDGTPSRIYKTNGVLRGVIVPGGEHSIVFTYVPVVIYASMAVSGALLLAMLFLLLRKT